jgi:hypothetical protein
MSTSLLKPKGCYWRDLQKFEKEEILTQMPGIKSDPNYCNYKFYYSSTFKHWIICNMFTVPMRSIKTLQVQQ